MSCPPSGVSAARLGDSPILPCIWAAYAQNGGASGPVFCCHVWKEKEFKKKDAALLDGGRFGRPLLLHGLRDFFAAAFLI